MKKVFSAIILFLFFLPFIHASDVTLAWDANTQPELRGYTLSYGNASGTYIVQKDAGLAVQYTVTGLDVSKKWYFVVQAYGVNDVGEPLTSNYSNEVSWPDTLLNPPVLTIQSIISQNGVKIYEAPTQNVSNILGVVLRTISELAADGTNR